MEKLAKNCAKTVTFAITRFLQNRFISFSHTSKSKITRLKLKTFTMYQQHIFTFTTKVS